jgi:hypothetical protein
MKQIQQLAKALRKMPMAMEHADVSHQTEYVLLQ